MHYGKEYLSASLIKGKALPTTGKSKKRNSIDQKRAGCCCVRIIPLLLFYLGK
jgi:hypothetical protein